MFLAQSAPSEVGEKTGKAHILLVDDERLLSEGLRLALQEIGYEATAAACGGEAKERILSCPIDIVLLDVGLPDVDGFTLCAELRKLRDVPIIILSGQSNIHDVMDGYHSGATDFVSKPFQLRILVQHIETALDAKLRATEGDPGSSPTQRERMPGAPNVASNDQAPDLHLPYTAASQRNTQSVIIPTTMVSNRF
jgi:DNA-binding response OmpR family regulator